MSHFDPNAYGPVFKPLLEGNRRRGLEFGKPDRAVRPALEALSANALFAHAEEGSGRRQPVDAEMADCCVAGVWLVHDFLDESHEISQRIDTPSGSIWHAIVHRREGDYANAKYWFRHAGRHDVLDFLGQRAAELAAIRGDTVAIQRLTASGTFDPLAFVDLCQSEVRSGSPKHLDLCVDIQQVEWELLFDWCYRAAIGKSSG
jgi:hypothetical protein